MKKLGLFLSFILILVIVSCEIGLGSSVDTEAPNLSIEEPVVDSIIAGDFDIIGTYSDDGIIKDLELVLVRTDELGTPIKISGVLEENPEKRGSGTWKIPVNAKSESIFDGTYQATVSIKDGAGRVTTQSTTFTIDNTPPVLILTKPNSRPGDETVSEYGQRLFLEGTIADTSKKTYITVEFYENSDFSGTPKILKTSAIAPTDVNSNNAKLAVFGNEDGKYESIYGFSEKKGSKPLYIKIKSSDMAGNETEEFYFSKDLAKNLTKSKESGDPEAYDLAAIDIYNVLNGTDALKGTARTVDNPNAVRELLDQTLNDDGIQTAMFNLNPENSPYFMVSGMKTLPDKWEEFASSDNGYIVINGAQTLEVSVFMGSDSIELVDDDDFYVYLLECKEGANGKLEVAEDIEENRIKLYSKSKEDNSGDIKKTYYSIGGKQGHRTTTGAYVFTIPMSNTLIINPDDGTQVPASKQYEDSNKYLKYGQSYVVRVSGKDNEGNPIENYENGYGFRFSAGGGAPELEITTPEESTVFSNGAKDISFEGLTKSEEGEPIISVLYNNEVIKIHNGDSEELVESIKPAKVGDNTFPFSFRIPKEWFTEEGREGSKTYTFTIRVIREDQVESKTEVKYSVWYDVEKPAASNIKLTEVTLDAQGNTVGKSAYKDESDDNKYYVNNKGKTFTLSGMATDNFGVDTVTLEITNKADETKKITEIWNESTGKWSFENLDLCQWNGSGADAEISIKDKSGNISYVDLDIIFDVTPPVAEHQIDDSQKDLVFRIGDYSNDAGDSDVGGKYSEGTYGSAVTMEIRGNFADNADGAGINKFYYKVFNNQEVKIDSSKASGTEPVAGQGEDTGMIFFNSLDVLKDYVITNKTDTFSPLTEIETRNVEYNILPENKDDSKKNLGGTKTNGDNLTSKGYVQFIKNVTTNYKTTIKGFNEGRNFLVLVAEDNVGNASVDFAEVLGEVYPCYSLNVDITAPTIPEKQEGIVYTNVVKKSESNEENPDIKVEISGTVSDKPNAVNGSSGLKNIVFTSDQSTASVTLKASEFTGSGTAEDSTLRNWTVDVRSLLERSGTAIISAKVTDNAGYETSIPVATVIVDMTAPTVRITSPAANSKTGTEITLSGTAGDGNGAGLNKDKNMILYYTTNRSSGASIPSTMPALDADASVSWKKLKEFNAEEDWTCVLNVSSLSEVTDGNNTEIFFTVSAADKAGSGTVGYAEPLRIVVDRKKPQIDDANSGLGNIWSAETIRNHWYNTTNLKLSGLYTDDSGSGVASVSYKIGDEVTDISTFNGSYSVSIANFVEGENSLIVWATDAVGNKSDETEYQFFIDNVAPEITSITGAELTKGENVSLTINIKDKNPETPEVLLKKDETEISLTATAPAGSGSTYSSSVTVPFESNSALVDGTYDIVVTVKDKAGNTVTKTHKILKDTLAPSEVIISDYPRNATQTEGTNYTFKGTAADNEGGSGLKKVELKFSKGSGTSAAETEWLLASGTTNWTYDAEWNSEDLIGVFGTEDEKTLTVKVTDLAGNTTEGSQNFIYDKKNPEVSVTGETITKNENITLTISINDTNPSVPVVTYQLGTDGSPESVTAGELTGSGSSWTSSVIIPLAGKDDGTYIIKINETDKNGRNADEVAHSILKDNEAPVITFTAPAESQSGYEKNTSYEFKGSVTDSNLKSVNAQLYKKNAESENFEAVEGQSTSLSTNQNNEWSWKVYELEDTSYKIKVTAEDKAGNRSEENSSELTVDNNPPVVTFTAVNLKNASGTSVSSVTAGDYYAGESTVILTGTVTDPNYENNSNYVTVTATNSVTTSQNYVDSNSFTVTPALVDGDTNIIITVKDLANNLTETRFVIHRDTTGPAIEIRNPQADSTNPLDDASFSFRVNISDAGVGVAKVYYKFTDSNETPSYWGSGENFDGGDFYITRDFINGHTETEGKLTEGNWYLHVKAADKSGNSTITDKDAEDIKLHPRHFVIDKTAPSIDYVKSGSNELTEKQNFYYDAESFTLTGKVSDTNGLSSVKVNNEVVTHTDGIWSKSIEITANQKNEIPVEVEDVAGRKTTKTYYVYKDTAAPVINLNSPAESVTTLTDNEYEFLGSIIDAGAGISTEKYLFTQTPLTSDGAIITAAEDTEGTSWIEITDGNFDVTKALGEAESNNLAEGKWYLYLYAKDNVDGNLANHKSVLPKEFWVDKALPEIDESAVGTAGANVKAEESLSLSGTVSDNNGIEKIEITEGTGTTAKIWTIAGSAITNGTWTKTIETGTTADKLADGTHTLTITAIDKAGRKNSIQRTVVVDTVAPTHGNLTITSTGKTVGSGDEEKIWFNSSFINIKIENVADAENGSGLSTVEYTTESGDDAHWYSMSGSSGTYTATVNCTKQGLNTIRVRISDVVGNTTNAGSLLAYIDTVLPTLESSQVKYIMDSLQAISELLINGERGYELQIEAKDEDGGSNNNSGIASVTYLYSYKNSENETVESKKTGSYLSGDLWKIEVSKENEVDKYSSESSNKIYAIIKDNAGNETKERILTVTKDTTPPTVEIKSFTRAGSQTNLGTESVPDLVDDVNGTITISGLADDTNKFGSVKLEYQKNGTSTWTEIPTTSQTSWSTTLNTKNLDDNTKYTIKATATDAAGNTKTDTQDIYVNQDSDRPVITVTNITLATVENETTYLKSTSKLEGTVSDDDGNVTKFEYSTNGTSWTEKAIEYGTAWSISDLPEGENKLYFRVTDSVNAIPFTTVIESDSATSEAANQPKIKDNNNTYVTQTQGSLALKFKVVTKKPDVQEIQYKVYNSSTNAWEDRESSFGTLGGIYTKFKISLKAKSEAFISKVQAKYSTDVYDINFTTTETTTNNSYHTWTTDEITLDPSKTEVKLKVSDASSTTDPMILEQTISYSVDNTAPTITIKEPSSTVGVKETMQFDMTEEATSYYAVTKSDVTTAPAADSSAWTEITDTSNGLTRYVFFDDDINETDHTDRFALYLTEATTEKPNRLGITNVAAIEATTNPYETITQVKFWVKAVDSCGNIGYANKTVNVDPQGNRPTVTLGYPVNVLKDGSYVAPTLGGTIRLDGNVSDDIAAKYVWIKIEREGNTFSGADIKFLKEKNYTIGNMTTNEVVADATITALADDAEVPDYAIRVPVTGTSWNLSINGNQEFNIQDAESNLLFKIYATDEDPDKVDASIKHIHRSAEITQNIVIDSRTPYISSSELKLVKYGDNSANKEYKEGTSVHGIWYLQGTIKDNDSGIRTISYKKNSISEYTNVITSAGAEQTNIGGDSHFYFIKVAHTDDENKFDYNFSVPLGNATAGQVGTDTITLKAVEATGQNLQVEQTYTVTYDNKAPEFVTDSENSFVKLSTDIYNSSGFYTFGAIAAEDNVNDVAQSGVERIAFYFTRDLEYGLNELDPSVYTAHSGTATNDLFDVMIYHSNVDADDVASGNMIVGYHNLTLSEGLYWRTHSGSANGKAFTYEGDADPNIHAGGLVKINGVIYKIKSVSGQTVILPSNIDTATSAQFALCNVIDNAGEKNGSSTSNIHGYGYGYYGSRVTDDGDLITETFNAQSSEWIFDASINSKNLPDGPIKLHMVAFDKAGNVTAPYTISGTVKNNAPRIAGLILGTDENGNGKVDAGEFKSAFSGKFVNGYDTAGNEMREVSFPIISDGGSQTSLLTVKGLTVVKPEIIGGNGAISYTYQVGSGAVVSGGNLAKDGGGNVSGTTDDVVTGAITLDVSAFIGTTDGQDTKAIPDGTLSEFKFTFGDSTPGTSLDDATCKNSAIMSVFLDVALRETNKAKNWILPFYWKSSSDNSLFGQSKDNGHIELAKDWILASGYNADKSEYDADPKVSGKIKIEGIAKDDTLLREIKVQFDKSMGGLGTTDTTIASYNETGAAWTVTPLTETDTTVNEVTTTTYDIPIETGWASAVQQATYQDLKDVGIITEIPEDKEPTSLVPYTSQDYGHVVHWILYLDTEKITGVANTDVTITATATDRGTPKWSNSENKAVYTANAAETTGGTAISGAVTKSGTEVFIDDLTGNYIMDIVPYIAKVYTYLGKLKSNNWSVYNRSALGHYPVAGDETIYIYGFNLGSDEKDEEGNLLYPAKYEETSLGAPANGSVTNTNYPYGASYASYQILTFPVSNVTTSGAISINVNGVETLNNLNSENAKGSYSQTTSIITGDKDIYDNYYNRQPNGDNNNLLTDDVVLDVWEINPQAVKPKIGTATQPVMQIDPINEHIGFAFVNGSVYYSMPRGTGTTVESISANSYEYWIGGLDFWNSVCFTYDKNGYVYGVAAGGDLNASKHGVDTFRLMTSRWNQKGSLKTDGYADANGQFGIEFIGEREYGQKDDGSYYGFTNFSKERIKSPSMVAVGSDDTTKSKLYLAYYDSINDEVRFKWGVITNSKDTSDDVGMFANDYDPGTRCSQPYSIASTSLIAGQTIGKLGNLEKLPKYDNKQNDEYNNKLSKVTTVSSPVTTTDGESVFGGEYVDIAVIPNSGTNDDAVVAVWWDGTHHKMLYSYNMTPTSIAKGAYKQEDTKWSKPVELFGAEIGEYCKVAADKNGGIHIAAYDSLNGDLWYAYLAQFNAPQNAKIGCIDSYGFVGNELNIDVALDENNNIIPYISYYALSCSHPKIAKWSGKTSLSSATSVAGVKNEAYTDNWESIVVPTSSKASIDHVTVGLWKDGDGKIKNSKTGVTKKMTTSDNGPTVNSYGYVYGNGTSNPVLGYAIKDGALGYIETAQMK